MADHDPLCPTVYLPGEGGCRCALIDRIRADERERIARECERTGNHHDAAIARGGRP